MKRNSSGGFTLIQTLIVVGIVGVISAVAVPIFVHAINPYRLSAAVNAAAGAVSATRFQAIMNGCPYELIFTASTMSYQVYNELPTTTGGGCATSFSAVGRAVPLPSAGPITMAGTSLTFTFYSNGTVTSVPSPAGTAFQLFLMPPKGTTAALSNTITVTGVGDVQVSSP